MQPDKWFYVIGAFSRKTGLQLYYDGVMVSDDKHGRIGNHKASDQSSHLYVGCNTEHSGFGRFQLASLSTFKGAMSPQTVSRVYSYFWRQGRSSGRLLDFQFFF